MALSVRRNFQNALFSQAFSVQVLLLTAVACGDKEPAFYTEDAGPAPLSESRATAEANTARSADTDDTLMPHGSQERLVNTSDQEALVVTAADRERIDTIAQTADSADVEAAQSVSSGELMPGYDALSGDTAEDVIFNPSELTQLLVLAQDEMTPAGHASEPKGTGGPDLIEAGAAANAASEGSSPETTLTGDVTTAAASEHSAAHTAAEAPDGEHRPASSETPASDPLAALLTTDPSPSMDASTPPPSFNEIVDGVVNACATLPRLTRSFPLQFPSTVGKRCEYWWHDEPGKAQNNTGGLTSQKPTVAPELPAGSVLCSSQLRTAAQDETPTWTYDDEFYLTLGDKVIVSSYKRDMERYFDRFEDLYIFNFEKLINKKYEGGNASDRYCYGVDSLSPDCQFPWTQTTAAVNIQIPAEKFAPVSALVFQEGTADFTLHLTGDNDPRIDCQHSGLDFDWEVEYVLLPSK